MTTRETRAEFLRALDVARASFEKLAQRPSRLALPGAIGARVEGDTVVVSVRRGNDGARELCADIVERIESVAAAVAAAPPSALAFAPVPGFEEFAVHLATVEAERAASRVALEASRWRKLRALAGHWQNGSDQKVTLLTDDATRSNFINAGIRQLGTDGSTFEGILDAMPEPSDD